MLDRLPLITASDRLYFAYGSNLSPEQMGRRCPDSIFLGKATLRGYRWQVNERGVANIVEVPAAPAPRKKSARGSSRRNGHSRDRGDEDDHSAAATTVVEGLLYAISEFDERLLDQYEGVEKGRYEKFGAQVDFEPVRDNVFARCTSVSVAKAVRDERKQDKIADALGITPPRASSWGEGEQRRSGGRDGGSGGRRGASVGASSSSSSTLTMGSGLKSSILELLGIPTSKTGRAASSPPLPTRGRDRTPRGKVTPVWAMVYASTTYVRDGDVKDRYVPRMERAMADAVTLGVSRTYVDEHILPHVLRTAPARRKSSRRKSLVGGEDDLEKSRRRREVESARRSVSISDGSGRHGRRDSVLDRSLDY